MPTEKEIEAKAEELYNNWYKDTHRPYFWAQEYGFVKESFRVRAETLLLESERIPILTNEKIKSKAQELYWNNAREHIKEAYVKLAKKELYPPKKQTEC